MVNYKNILLINPSIDTEKKYGELVNMILTPKIPLSLLCLGGYIKHKGYNVRLHNEEIELLTESRLQNILNEFSPGIIGFSCTTPGIGRAFELAENIRQISDEIKIVIGNVHPTVLPEESLKNTYIDLVVRGEGENTIIDYIEALNAAGSLSKINGISYRQDDGIIHNTDREYIKDLDYFPKFDWQLLTEYGNDAYEKDIVLTSRGCPYKCIFCSSRSVSGYQYRVNSPQRVLEEVDVLVKDFGRKFISFADDNFVINKKRTEEICNLLIERGYSQEIKWMCQTRVDALDEPLLDLMKKAGCDLISFGIETGTQRLLDYIRKSVKIEKIEQMVTLTHKAGIKARGSFMLGIPTETHEDSLATIDFALKLPLDFAKFNLAVPYPGTELLQIVIDEGLEVTDDWSKINSAAGFTNTDAFYIPKGRTMKELAAFQKQAHRKFYLRPKQIIRILKGENFDFNIPKYISVGQFFRFSKAIAKFLIQSYSEAIVATWNKKPSDPI